MAVVLFLVSLAVVLLVGPKHAVAQEALRTTVSVETDRGFGRILLTLPDLTKFIEHDVSTDDNILVLELAQPLDVDILPETDALRDYVRIARQDPDGRVLRFALNTGVRVNAMTAGEHLFIDFLPVNWRGELPAIPDDIIRKLEERAEAALELAEQNAIVNQQNGNTPELTMRIGRHPTFSRFMFSWNVSYGTSFRRDGPNVVIIFDKSSEIDLRQFNADLPPLVTGIRAQTEQRSTTITLELEADALVRSYFDDGDYVVDVTSENLRDNDTARETLPFVVGGLPNTPTGSNFISQTEGLDRQRALAAARQRDPGRWAGVDAPSPVDTANAAEDNGTASDSPEQIIERDLEGNETLVPNAEAVNLDAAARLGVTAVRAQMNELGDAVRLVFPFEDETPAAIFRRDRAVWMVFDTENVIDTTAIRGLLGDFIMDVQELQRGDYKAIRLALSTVELASAAIDDQDWVISIGSSVIKASEQLVVSRSVDEEGSLYLKIPIENAVGEVAFKDPTVGDNVHVIVANPPSRGLVRQQEFVDLRILPSTHAIAYVPLTDNVVVRINDENVALTGNRTLHLSPSSSLRASVDGGFTAEEWFDVPLDARGLSVNLQTDFLDRESELLNNVVSATDEDRPRRRIELAQFYAVNGFGPEALASLRRAIAEQPVVENKRAYIFTKAAAEVAMERYDDVLVTLGDEKLAEDQHAAVWRMIALAGLGKWEDAARNASLGRQRLAAYDPEVKQDFFLKAADASLRLSDLSSARNYLQNIILREASEHQLGYHEILQGDLAVAEGRFEDARFFYDRASETNDTRIEAAAQLKRIQLDYRTDAVENNVTIDKLERFALGWRKDQLELEALSTLAEALIEEEQYRRAFELVEVANISDEGSDLTRGIHDQMQELFLHLFHRGYANALPAVDALALYYDFRSLMPIGRIGDEIVRYLAARLIDLDLLPQAAELLTHQVEKRLSGAASARVAADLAVVQLMDNEPQRAITTLRRSQTANLPVALDRQRRMVEAFALSKIGRHDLGLDLLAALSGDDVDRLRATINWEGRRWTEAGELLEKIHTGRWSDVEPLDPSVRLDILRAAIAFSLARDEFALNRLNQKFGEKMAESPDAATFQILAQPFDGEGFERDVAIDSILAVNSADSFLQDYRRRYLVTQARGIDA